MNQHTTTVIDYTKTEDIEILVRSGHLHSDEEIQKEVIESEKLKKRNMTAKRAQLTRLATRNRKQRSELSSESDTWAPKIKPYRRGRD